MPRVERLAVAAPIFSPLPAAGAGMAIEERSHPSSALLRRTCENAAVASLQQTETRFRALIDSAPVLIWMSCTDEDCEFFNQRWLDFRGRRLEQELGSGWTEGLHSDDRDAVILEFRAAHAARGPFEMEFRFRRHDGQYRWMLAAGTPRFSAEGDFVGFVGGCIDITDRKQAVLELQGLLAASDEAHARLAEQTQRLHELAESDPLTGMLNRRSFRDQFQREWDRAVRYERALACIMLDVDFFKRINDTHGHATGDAVLKQIAELLIRQCRPSDRVCRYGGEEFCIVAPETTEEGAAALAERLRATLADSPIEVDGKSICVASSFGVAERTGEMNNMDDLIGRADQMLHVAKQTGRNLVIEFAVNTALTKSLTPANPSQVLSRVTARELALPTVCVRSDETIQFAVQFLLRHNLGTVPVVDADGRLVGSISDRDLAIVDLSHATWSRPVRDVMKTNVVSYEENTPGDQIFHFLCRVSIQQVVVVKDARPTGVINLGAVLNFFQRRVADEAGRLHWFS